MGESKDSGQPDVRPKKLTDKAQEERVKLLKTRQTAALGSVTKSRNEIVRLMAQKDNLHLAKTAFDKFSNVYEAYENAHT